MSLEKISGEDWNRYFENLQPYVLPEHRELAQTIPGPDRELALAIAMTHRELPQSLDRHVADFENKTIREMLEDHDGIAVVKLATVQMQFPKPYWSKMPFLE